MRASELRLSNLGKVFWPGEGITKGDLIDYYRAVAPFLLPHLRDRPFTMKRYPDGWQASFFFQKDASSHVPAGLRTVPIEVHRRDGTARTIAAPVVDDEPSLLWMVNGG